MQKRQHVFGATKARSMIWLFYFVRLERLSSNQHLLERLERLGAATTCNRENWPNASQAQAKHKVAVNQTVTIFAERNPGPQSAPGSDMDQLQ